MLMHRYTFIVIIFLALFTQGCNTLEVHYFAAHANRPTEYLTFYKNLDQAVKENGVKDAANFSITGFPYLRGNDFLIGLKDKLTSNAQKELWVKLMRGLDIESREKEIQNLPSSAIARLARQFPQAPSREALIKKLSLYSQKLLEHDQSRPNFYELVKKGLGKPSEYSPLVRTAQVCPIFSIPVVVETARMHKKFKNWQEKPLQEIKVQKYLKFYTPPHISNFPSDAAQMFDASRRNALGMPQLSEDEIQQLVMALAPVFEQDEVADYDQIGEMVWDKNHVKVNGKKPVVYYYITYAFIRGEPVMQINYVIWYSARGGPHTPWIERGPIDGLTLRITLDGRGQPVMTDIMNNCGCYHFFVPNKEKIVRIVSNDTFVPTWLPETFPQKHLHLRMDSGRHLVVHIFTDGTPQNNLPYELKPYDVLETLAHDNGRTESIFTREGILKDSSRLEPLVLFSAGIAHIGSMRQRGHHAIKLVGEEDFTDPELFDKNFVFK